MYLCLLVILITTDGVFKFIGLSTVLILFFPQSLLTIILKDEGFFGGRSNHKIKKSLNHLNER